ncbi:hypothetical protein [Rickettsia rhipicephali]|uniref:hypothetical protein n=1 Tax=Rickettsia rhipicephali TaxID=33992 RepID=UPI001E411EF6|nr:hypothetical protein [Rickettsia rhipicephali]
MIAPILTIPYSSLPDLFKLLYKVNCLSFMLLVFTKSNSEFGHSNIILAPFILPVTVVISSSKLSMDVLLCKLILVAFNIVELS